MKQVTKSQGRLSIKDRIALVSTVLGILTVGVSVLYLVQPDEVNADEYKYEASSETDFSTSSIIEESSFAEVAVKNSEIEYSSSSSAVSDSSDICFSGDFSECDTNFAQYEITDTQDTIPIIEDDVGVENDCEAESNGYVLDVPNWDIYCDSNRKLYMAYTAVTDTASDQYNLLYSQAYTTPEGLRAVGGRYCIALGSYYTTTVGQKVDLILADGGVIHCILGDCKADCHTNDTHQYNWGTGNVAEFIVDSSVFDWQCDGSGTVNWVDGLDGEITSIVLVD